MYPVSDEYRTAMHSEVQSFRMDGLIGDIPFHDENILSGSFSITNQCSDENAVLIGQVYVGELNATFLDLNIPRYAWKGKEIKPSFGMKLADGSFEFMPLGVFTIDSAEWTASGVVVKAYDHMAKLDASCSKIITEVTTYQCAKYIEEQTGVEFANTEEDFLNFANGDLVLSEDSANDVETWRDLVSWLAQTCGCFATADREGRIVFREYNQTVVDTLDTAHRFKGGSFSDFITRYTGLSVVDIATKETHYYGLEQDDGLTMNLGSNPFMQYGISETKEQMARAVLSKIQNINYVPFKVSLIGNPAYDLGDVFIFPDGLADGDRLYCMTKYTFQYNRSYQMVGVGKDPALATARSKVDKNIAGLISNTDEAAFIHYQFVNTSKLDVGDGKKKTAATIRFATAAKDSEVVFWAEILLEAFFTEPNVKVEKELIDTGKVDESGEKILEEKYTVTNPSMQVMVEYMLNGTVLDYQPVEVLAVEGKHILTLHYYIGSVKANTIYSWVVSISSVGGKIQIPTNSLNAVVEGLGLAGTGQWDGTITAEDEWKPFIMARSLGEIEDTAKVEQHTPKPVGLTESFRFDFGRLLGGMKAEVSVGTVMEYYILSDTEGSPEYDATYVEINSSDAFVLRQDFRVKSKRAKVDTGQLDVVDIFETYEQVNTLKEVVI